ncbi:MAG: hypothetical protein COA78_14355 [Blastopirellula sp.]|nr:MAG: hypothetical protein COA78_14355 [Blastopirellula sp.]
MTAPWTPFNKFTDNELIRDFRYDDTPLVREFAERLETSTDELKAEILELTEAVGGLENAECPECQAWETEKEKLEDEYEDRIEKLEEQVAHEVSKAREFYDENQQFLAEIEELKSNLEQKDETMIEEQLKEQTALLREILAAIKAQGTTEPAASAKAANTNKAKPKKVAKEPEVEETADEKDAAISHDDVQQALLDVRDAHGKPAALAILEKFADGKHLIKFISEDDYAAVLAACADLDQKEAA